MSASITVDVSEAVERLDPKTMERYIIAALDGAADLLLEEIKPYPPKPPDSRYRRTMTLHDSWTKKVGRSRLMALLGGNLKAVVGSNVKYAPYVQDRDEQAWMHKGRWKTAQDVAETKAQEVKDHIERALARWAR